MGFLDWIRCRIGGQSQWAELAEVLVNETLCTTRDCVLKHFKLDDADEEDVAMQQTASGLAYLALVFMCLKELGLLELAEAARARFAALDRDLGVDSGSTCDGADALVPIIRRDVGSVAELDEKHRGYLHTCIMTILRDVPKAKHGTAASSWFGAGSVCDESAVAEEIVVHYDSIREALLHIHREQR